jgi:hypothetical protein
MPAADSSVVRRPGDVVEAHARADAAEFARLQTLNLHERAKILEAACEAAMDIERSRLAGGLPKSEPAPWPESTWEFLHRHASHVRG